LNDFLQPGCTLVNLLDILAMHRVNEKAGLHATRI